MSYRSGTRSTLSSPAEPRRVYSLIRRRPAASSVTLLATADATLRSGFPNGNFGGTGSTWTCRDMPARAGRSSASCFASTSPPACHPARSSTRHSCRCVSARALGSALSTAPRFQRDGRLGRTQRHLGQAPGAGDPRADAQVGTAPGWCTWDVTAIAQGCRKPDETTGWSARTRDGRRLVSYLPQPSPRRGRTATRGHLSSADH